MSIRTLLTLILAMTIWGNIESYTNHDISVNGKTYYFSKDVIMDTYSLEKNEKGNVRVELDPGGMAAEIYFYGIDMPDVIRTFKNVR